MTNPRIIFPRVPRSYTHYYDYLAFIELRLCRPKKKSKAGHLHHIVPKCMGGNDQKSNLVFLTFGEHFTAHYLLFKVFPGERGLLEAIKLFNKANSWEYQEAMGALSLIPVSEETRDKLRVSTTNLWRDEDYRRKVSGCSRGHKMSEEGKRVLSEFKKKQWADPEYKYRMAHILEILATPPSEETRNKMSKSHKGKKLSPKHIAAAADGKKDKEVWKHFDDLFILWNDLGKCGPYKLWTHSGIGVTQNALKTMVREFKKMI